MTAPVYVVSGWMRSGTSMMMHALETGGMEAAYRTQRDKMRVAHADKWYDPNPGGLYELHRDDYRRAGFPAGYEGKLVKALRRGPSRMAHVDGGIKCVYMLRDHEEQRQSLMGFFGNVPPTVEKLAAETELNLAAIRARDDIDLMTLEYADVIADPKGRLAEVAAFFGVDLDVDKAASVVSPDLYRYRKENLEPGVV